MLVKDAIAKLAAMDPNEEIILMIMVEEDFSYDGFTKIEADWPLFVSEWEGQKWNRDAFADIKNIAAAYEEWEE